MFHRERPTVIKQVRKHPAYTYYDHVMAKISSTYPHIPPAERISIAEECINVIDEIKRLKNTECVPVSLDILLNRLVKARDI